MNTFSEPNASLFTEQYISLGAKDAMMSRTQDLYLKWDLGERKACQITLAR